MPPVNQGRTRKVKKRRNVEAAASTTSLAETASGRASSSTGPSRVGGEPQPRESPRRPRQGSGSRTISSPEFRSSPYPDYPPPSFEEVLALDRRSTSSTTPIPPSSNEPVSRTDNVALPLLQVPSASPGPSRNQPTVTTPWEQDRLLGLSLEERVQREFERSLKHEDTSASPRLDSDARPASLASAPDTPTSAATVSNFLTPQNLTPSPSDVALPLSENRSPNIGSPSRSPSPPPKSPDPAESLVSNTTDARPAPATTVEPRTSKQVDTQTPKSSSEEHEYTSPEQPSSQTSLSRSVTPLASLLFTTRLRLDDPLETNPIRESTLGCSPSREGRPQSVGSNRQANVSGHIGGSPQKSPFPLEPLAHQALNGSPQRNIEDTPHPSEDLSTPPRGRSPSRPLFVPGSSLRATSPVKPGGSAVLPSTVTPEPSQLASSTTPRRPPPPPPPRPRPRQVGSGVAARISAYEALLADAPKVPPPLPPRPRPISQTSSSATREAEVGPSNSRSESTLSEADSSSGRDVLGRSPERGPQVPAVAHTITTRPPPPPPAPRRLSSLILDPSPAASPEPQSRVRPLISSRPLPPPPVAGPSRRIPSPERAQIPAMQPQALVPARIGSDGKLEIIPDADIIWLDNHLAKGSTGTPVPRNEAHREGAAVTPGAAAGIAVRPSPRENLNPFEDSLASPVSVTPPVVARQTLPSQPASPVRSPISIAEPSNPLDQTSTATSPPRLADDFEYTDLDLLISRLEENEAARQGANYEVNSFLLFM